MTDVAVREQHGSDLTIGADQGFWSEKQVAVLRQLGLEEASNADLAVFFHQAVRTGLDPFARQIYMIGRWSREGTKFTIQTGIDGYRLVARRAVDRAHETLEYEETLYCGKDGRWTDVWLADEFPAAAKVVVLRGGQRFPAVALWKEYVQLGRNNEPNSMWARMGSNQLAKCAEALALRKAFPQDLSGIYTDEEMGQADARAEAERDQRTARQQIAERDTHRAVPAGPRAIEGQVAEARPAPTPDAIATAILSAATIAALDKMVLRLQELGITDTDVEVNGDNLTLGELAQGQRERIEAAEKAEPKVEEKAEEKAEEPPAAAAPAPAAEPAAKAATPAHVPSATPDPEDQCKPGPARTGVIASLGDMGVSEEDLATYFGRPVAQVATRKLTQRVKDVIAERRAAS